MARSAKSEFAISKELSAAAVRPLVLAIVAAEPTYGYAILQRVRALSEGRLDWKEGMLYPVLHRLEREGLLESFWEKGERGRKRKYYRVTDRGSRAAERERDAWLGTSALLDRAWSGLS